MKVRRVDFSPDEWLAGTTELSDEDRGVYITICALIYSRGGRIEYELLKRHSQSHGNKLMASLDRLEKGQKIVRNGLEIGQKRSENELENARKRSEKASENGLIGNQIKALKIATRDGVALAAPHANHQPSTTRRSNPPNPPYERGASSAPRRKRKNGYDDPFGLADLTENELGRRFNDKTTPTAEKDAIRKVLFPGTYPPGL